MPVLGCVAAGSLFAISLWVDSFEYPKLLLTVCCAGRSLINASALSIRTKHFQP
jgi:hypothetical protein